MQVLVGQTTKLFLDINEFVVVSELGRSFCLFESLCILDFISEVFIIIFNLNLVVLLSGLNLRLLFIVYTEYSMIWSNYLELSLFS